MFDEEHPDTLTSKGNLAMLYTRLALLEGLAENLLTLERAAEALPVARELLRLTPSLSDSRENRTYLLSVIEKALSDSDGR